MIAPILALLLAADKAPAQNLREEIITFNISMLEQTCRRASEDEPYVCSSEAPNTQRLTVSLLPVRAEALEEQAYEGSTTPFVLSRPGSPAQYLPAVQVRKSVGMGGASVIYVLRFRAQQIGATIQKAPVYETVYISADTLRMSEPLLLTSERQIQNEHMIKQITFSAMPAVQFSGLIPDPE